MKIQLLSQTLQRSRRRRRWLSALLGVPAGLLGVPAGLIGVPAGLVALATGCDDSGPRVYTAQRHSVEADCLEAYAPVGLVEAETVSSLCEPACLALGADLYVSSVCPPYPAEASLEPEDSEGCEAALAAPSCDDASESPDAAAP